MKKILWLLLFSFSLFFTSQADAAEILQSSGSGFSGLTVQDNKVRINLTGGNVKYIRHTKYEQSSWSDPVAYKQLRASSTFTGFAYSCPGYYMTRIYSDSAGTKLIGWVRVYVENGDINNPGCKQILDEQKKVPSATKKINVTHPSDVVDEPSKMITQSTAVSSAAPVTRDTTDEDLVEFEAGQVPEGTLTAEQACAAKATSTGVAYQLKYNSNTSSWECVVTSDCLVNGDLWHCNAQTVAEKYPSSTTTIDNPERDLYHEDSCSDATAANCLDMYTMSNYSHPTNEVINTHVSDGGTTEPTDPGDSGGTTDPTNPNVDPVMEEKCSIDANFESDECIKYRFCLDSPDHPDCKEHTEPPTENVCFPGGEPDFTNPDCHFNCAHPDLMDYEECAPDTSYFQDMRYCWTEDGEFKWDSPYCDIMFCDDTEDYYYQQQIECGGPVDCMDYEATEQRLLAIEGYKNLNAYGDICGNLGPERGDYPFGDRYYQLDSNNCTNVYGDRLNRNPSCAACYITELEKNLGVERELKDDCPVFPEDVKGGLITEVAELLDSPTTGGTCACEGELGQLCCLFQCPGWEEYLSFITDTVKMAIGDITTPEVEPLPDLQTPSTPSTPQVDKKQLDPPTGQEDPALEDASFDANDLKNGEEIQFREDPGGFNITNPLEQLEGTAREAPRPSLGSVTQPQPTGGNADSNTAERPVYNGGTATAPTTGGTAQQPSYSGSAKVPTYTPPATSSVPKQTDERKVEVIAP